MNAFDSIINALDQHLVRKEDALASVTITAPTPQVPSKPRPPRFHVGDVIIMCETHWPPKGGRTLYRTGMYSSPGYPRIDDIEFKNAETNGDPKRRARLSEHLTGNVMIGDVCKVLAVWCCEEDDRWYYFIDNGKRDGQGWTRCCHRFERYDATKQRQR